MTEIGNYETGIEEIENHYGKITEVYSMKIPRLSCLRKWFAKEIVEMDFAEEFEVESYNSEERIGKRKRKMCGYRGRFKFAPDVEVSVYEGDRFARVYLRYEPSADEQSIEEVRERIKNAGLERRIIKQR